MSRRGGETRNVCEAPSDRGASWGAEFIVFAGAQGPLYKVPVGGGTPEPVTTLDEGRGETAHRFPHFLPDGETFLYVALPGKSRLLTVFAGHVDGRPPTAVTTALTSPVYAEPGYLLFQRGRKIVAQAFDAKTLTVSGEPIAVDDAPANLGIRGAARPLGLPHRTPRVPDSGRPPHAARVAGRHHGRGTGGPGRGAGPLR